jgi:DUF1680 family protein
MTNPVLDRLPLGATRPTGWMARQMRRDFESGFVGHLDRLVPALFEDDVYGRDRLTRAVTAKDVGARVGVDCKDQAQFLWWNSETQSNWRDGWLRHALLVGGNRGRAAAAAYVARMLATQDEDGYLGIYAPDLRYRCQGENGELWGQTTLLRGLLAYFEATADQSVLHAVIRAVDRTRQAWPLPGSQPFGLQGTAAGSAHGLMFVDVLDRLSELTGDASYRDYAVLLYEAYSRAPVSEPDCQLAKLLDPGYRFQGHGVHTWEHLRAVVLAATHAPSPAFQRALDAYLQHLERCTTPTGAPIGDEWIAGRDADADETGYEYCSILELLDSYLLLLQKTGDARWADQAEHLVFNAALGARHPCEPSLAYLKTDNSLSMTGVKHHDRHELNDSTQTRYRYSPVHQEAAVCCVPNAGRVLPSFVQAQVALGPDGPVVALYGASRTSLTLAGTEVGLEQVTRWPDEMQVALSLHPAAPLEFTLTLRRPAWAEDVTLECSDAVVSTHGPWMTVRKRWQRGDQVTLQFHARPQAKRTRSGQVYFQHGPLVYALALDGRTEATRQWPFGGFREIVVVPAAASVERWTLRDTFALQMAATPGALTVPLLDPRGREAAVKLVPVKETVLRCVTFKVGAHGVSEPPLVMPGS